MLPPDANDIPPPLSKDKPPKFRENDEIDTLTVTAYQQEWETRWNHLYYQTAREQDLENATEEELENPQTQTRLRLALLRQAVASVAVDGKLRENPGLTPIAFKAIANSLFLNSQDPSGLPPLKEWLQIETFLSSTDLSSDSAFYSHLKEAVEFLLASPAP